MTGSGADYAGAVQGVRAPVAAIHRGSLGRTVALTLAFLVFLYPLLADALSVNYSFVLLPVLVILLSGSVQRPDDTTTVIIGLFAFVLALAFLYQIDFTDQSLRRLTSFGIFMTVFAFVFIRVDTTMVTAFKWALIGISLYFSLQSMTLFTSLSRGGSAGYEAKVLVGSQRFGFIHVMAFWLVYGQVARNSAAKGVRYATLLVISIGLLLTFSRASVVALLATLMLFAARGQLAWLRRPTLMGVFKVGATVAGAVALMAVLYRLVPVTFQFFGERLFGFLLNSDAVAAHLSDPNASEGTRVFLAARVLEFVARNPLTGSGYLGVWVLPDVPVNSAHNQYLDVLFRTGIPGLLAFGYLLLRVTRYLARHDRDLFWGFVGVLIYGMFHETFKESHGAFVLAFLLGMMAETARRAKAGVPALGSTAA